jgi:hypothetical protein
MSRIADASAEAAAAGQYRVCSDEPDHHDDIRRGRTGNDNPLPGGEEGLQGNVERFRTAVGDEHGFSGCREPLVGHLLSDRFSQFGDAGPGGVVRLAPVKRGFGGLAHGHGDDRCLRSSQINLVRGGCCGSGSQNMGQFDGPCAEGTSHDRAWSGSVR